MTTLITGGTGKTGRRVADRMIRLGHGVRPVSRSTQPRFDWTDPTTWAPAVDGCSRAYVTVYPDLSFPGVDQLIAEFARTAVEAGCTRLVLLSGRGEEGALKAEEALAASQADWTVVRCAFFAQNFTEGFWAEEIPQGSLTMLDTEVGEPFVDVDDIADVVVTCLTEPEHSGLVHELTGPRLLSVREAVAEITRVTGRPIAYRPVPAEDFRAVLIEAGASPLEADGLTALFQEVLDGRNEHLTDGVKRVLRRQPRDLTDVIASAHGA